jgi:hypothetical protein
VSPRWRDELAISLAPDRLALLRRARGLAPREVEAEELAVAPAAGDALGPALARLAEALSAPRWQRAAARVVVADPAWARFAVVPWPGVRLDAAGRQAHARFVLGDAYGPAVADWAVALEDAPPGRACVACAMPPTLRSDLEAALAPARLTLVSLRARLVVAFEAWRRQLPAAAWFVRAGEGSLSAVRLRGGAWEQVHAARLAPDWGVELERLRALDRLTGADGALPVFVDAPAGMRPGASGAEVEWLEGDGAAGGHDLELLRRMCA